MSLIVECLRSFSMCKPTGSTTKILSLFDRSLVRCGVYCTRNDACIVSQSPQGLAKMIEAIAEVCQAFALTVSAKKTDAMCMLVPRKLRTMV